MRELSRSRGLMMLSLAALAAVLLVGCSRPAVESEVKPVDAKPGVAVAVEDDAVLASALIAADASDGAADRVIRKCVPCQLQMSGDASHSSTALGYEFHACSASCKQLFEADPAGAVKALPPVS